MHRIDTPTATADHKFTEGNPQSGVASTVVSADILNAFQEEIANAIEQAGIDLEKADNTQLAQAMAGMAIGMATTTEAGKVELATSGEAVEGTDPARAVTPLGLAAALLSALAFIQYGADTSAGTAYLRVGTLLVQVGKGTLPSSGAHRSSVAISFAHPMTSCLHLVPSALRDQITPNGFAPVMTVDSPTGVGATIRCDVNEGDNVTGNNINVAIPFTYLAIGTVANVPLGS